MKRMYELNLVISLPLVGRASVCELRMSSNDEGNMHVNVASEQGCNNAYMR